MARLDAPRLDERERHLLERAVKSYRPDLESTLGDLLRYERRLSAEEGNELRDAALNALIAEGFRDEDDGVNDLGLEYEHLIDRLGRITAVFD
jgi:hypothetical protein